MFARATRRVAAVAKRNATRAMHTSQTQVRKNAAPVVAAAGIAAATAALAFGVASEPSQSKAVAPIAHAGVPGTKHERTFIAIKPDGVERGLIAEVISRFEKKGYKLVAMKFITASEARAREHYADLSARPFFPGLVKYFTSGPIVCMVWEGTDVILTGRKILGATNPNAAAPGTIRGDNCISTGRNLIHGSDGPDSAKHEITMWFKPEEMNNYERALDSWIVSDN
uniref:Nucleoside diphosphate kinase n=1 Tax=Globisporangium ultimum (strain ATCC 200006 / CBS 805.95 / DAOM BR144) TaxID=431595 RepID=K3W517_GLOUD